MKNLSLITKLLLLLFTATIAIYCSTIPQKAEPIKNFDVNKYLGTWYEIARYDYSFERDLDNVAAQYTINDKGEITVFNSGYNYKDEKWQSATGSAKFSSDNNIGALKVSFFKPFYANYNVVAIDKDYKYALIFGNNLKYIWILSREKTIPEDIKQNYLKIAQDTGYDVDKLIWVNHNKQNPLLK